ncbi:hypothetical protein BU23DRAFT_597951 [Bimuria novae-zelandiae CBS 107.79]|uniref:Extracellular membrane protein CFEM domain-containing protein n=1 Tax=Bimuria novae-zelandiae CBS 107.79 TaxID=1447943 RepID=A0A6A5VIY5_9PLEO|nr:hypothetical protein BU23DRAFT_597951 [Bimuria novae-zelandiae CBS 107.79]
MWFSIAAALVVVSLIVEAAAHGRGGWDWVHGLPSCWGNCLDESGCNSRRCICDSSQDGDYLTSAVECMVRSCDADGLTIALSFLAPLQMYCMATGDGIPGPAISSAYACATATTPASTATPSPTRKVPHSTQTRQTTKEANNGLESTITSTVTLTTTNGDGNTVQVLIPIEMGPSTMITGEIITSTLGSESNSVPATTSNAEPATEPTSALPSQTQNSPSSSSTARPTNIGNGSPFDLSTGEGAAQRGLSASLYGAFILLGAFLRI